MPKEVKKRGRREAKKREEEREAERELAPKEQPQDVAMEEGDYDGHHFDPNGDTPFYGLLDEQESEYFRKADEILELDQFGSPDEKAIFIENVFKEAQGKELKLACSQGCSRLLERLIVLAAPTQLKHLLQIFQGNYQHLVNHRFASHCCETLFTYSAPAVSAELNGDIQEPDEMAEGEVFVTMETMILYAVAEIEPNLVELLVDRFASHTIRVLMLVLTGQALSDETVSRSIKSKKAEDITGAAKVLAERRRVPPSFNEAADRILEAATKALSIERIRQLSVDPLGAPGLIVLLGTEFGRGHSKQKGGKETLFKKITSGVIIDESIPDDKQDESALSYFNNLTYDPVGSHFVETMVRSAPKKEFKKLYKSYFRQRIQQLARNEVSAFIVQQIFGRLEKAELEKAAEEVVKLVPSLVERGRTSVLRSLIDACVEKEVDTAFLAEPLKEAYGFKDTSKPASLLLKLLKVTKEELTKPAPAEGEETLEERRPQRTDSSQRHAALFVQSLVTLPGDLGELIRDSILAQTPDILTALSQSPSSSYVIQKVLTTPPSEPSKIFKRKLLNSLRGAFAALAQHPSGSHVVDAAWGATSNLINVKQAIAEELLAEEAVLRESFFGRTVWRNWKMDKYKRDRRGWFAECKRDDTGEGERKKTPLELARERHAAKKNANATGVNGVPVGGKRGAEEERKSNVKRPRL